MRLTNTALLALVASPAAAWKHASEANIRKALTDNERTLVAFVEPSLEPCKRLDIEWTQAAKEATDAAVLSIDCTQDTKLCAELDVASYPAIRLFHRDSSRGVQRYRGVREAPDLLAFLRRAARPVPSTVDEKNFTTLLKDDFVVFVARYGKTSNDDETLPARFEQLASTYADRYTFAVSTDLTTSPSVTCYRSHGELVRTAAELDASTTALNAFIETCAAPLVVDLTRRNELHHMGTGKSLVHYLYSSASERRTYIKEVQKLAQTYGEYLQFTTVNLREYGDDMLKALGLQKSAAQKKGPLLAVQNPSNGDVFPFPAAGINNGDGPPAAAVVEKFLLDIIQGAVPPWMPGAGDGHDEL
ncbi:hypothetical protein Sste5346_000912 [Sporothrix stenoceras]|uniref:Protein disulfide-isomerase n=1 Tax=Sporothrix stenoceras TaxID=5173 RepID=A0ABR3ZSC4_9PEZI